MNLFRKRWVLLFSIPIYLLFINKLYATSPKIPLAVEIIDIRVVGEPLVGNYVTLEVDYKVNIDGEVQLVFAFPKAVIPIDGTKQKETKFKYQKNGVYTERIKVKVTDEGASLVNVIAQMENAPDSIRKQTSRHITIDHGKKDYAVFSSVKNDFVKKTKSIKKERQFKELKGNDDSHVIDIKSVTPTLKSATESSTYYVNIRGSVTYDDFVDSRIEGLYGGKIHFWFRKSSTPNQLYHPRLGTYEHVHYDNINTNGSFSFSFSTTANLTGYDQLVLLVGSGNPYVSYSLPDGYVISTDQGDLTTFGYQEGAVLSFNPSNSSVYHSSIDIMVNSEDGALLRNMMFAGELVKQRYGGNMPFSMPIIQVTKQDMSDADGRFSYGRNWVPFRWVEYRSIKIDPDATNAAVTTHEYGHYVNYQMFGGKYKPMSETSSQVKEGWAIFYSFAARNYSNRVYTDGIIRWDDNTEEDPFMTPRFRGIRYADAGYPTYAAFACYLWNLYDDYSDGNFKASTYSGDNDDVSGQGKRVFEIMRSMSEKNPGDYNNMFRNGLNADLQISAQNIYDNMLVNAATPMRPAQVKTASGSINSSSSVSVNWQRNTYSGFPFYSNRESGYRLYQSDMGSGWSLVSTLGNSTSSYIISRSSAAYKNYKISTYNNSGNSYGDIIISLPCNSVTKPYTNYYSPSTISGCSVTLNGGNVQNNSSLTIDARNSVTIKGSFTVQPGSTLTIK